MQPSEEDTTLTAQPVATRLAAWLASWKVWTASAVLFVAFAWAFFASSAPFSIPEVENACRQTPLDMRFFSTADDVTTFLDDCGPLGRNTYRNMQLADLFYPAIVGSFLASSLSLAIRRLRPRNKRVHWMATIPIIASIFDYVENTFAWLALATHPAGSRRTRRLGP